MSAPPFAWSETRPRSRSPFPSSGKPAALWLKAAVFCLALCATGEVARLFSFRDPSLVSYSLPAGLYTAVLLLNPSRVWAWFIAAAFIAHLAIGAFVGTPWVLVLGFYSANTLQAAFGAWLVHRFVGTQPSLATLREFAGFLATAVIAGPLAGALVGAMTLSLARPADSFGQAWERWWVGQALAILLLGTAWLAWQPGQARRPRRDRRAKVIEAIVLVAGLAVVAGYILVVDQGIGARYKPLLMSFALWAGLRFGLRGATAVNLWSAGVLAFLSLHVFRGLAPDQMVARELVTSLQSFLAMTALVSIVPAIALHERDHMLAELRESENRFRCTLDALPAAAYTCDADGRITYFNRRAEIVWGRAPRLSGQPERFCGSYRLFHADGSPVPRNECWMALALSEQRTVAAAEVVIERPDGTRRTVLAHASPLFDAAGVMKGAVNVLTDVTELKCAKQALIANEALLRQFIKHAPAAVAMFDMEMRYVKVSEQWATQFNLGGHDLIGRSHYDVSPEIPERWKAVHRRVLAGAVESSDEDSFTRADGETEWLQWDARPWRMPDGAIGGLIMFTQVITERIRMKAALRASEERFRSAMHHSPIGMALVSVDGRLIEVNPALSEICGYTREQLLTRDFQSITHPDDIEPDLRHMREVIDRRRDSYQMEKRYVHRDGRLIWIQLSVSLIWNSDGTPRHFVSQIQDITDKKRAEEQRTKLEAQLRQAQKMEAIGTLAGGIAHDFNNILAGVMGNLQLAELDLPANHPAGSLLQEAMRASRRARDLVARILTFSRRSENLRTSTALGPIVEETLQLLRATVPATLEIHTEISLSCPPVRCDGAQIHQVVLNLGGNAAAAMRKTGGRMEISLRHGVPERAYRELHPQVREHHTVRLSVRDTGHGMTAAVRERIFEPFFTTKGPGEGTGLGLAVVHGIVQDLGGAIVVESEEGKGTTFDLFFPACADDTTPSAILGVAAVPERTSQSGTGERILVVDDDETVLAVAASILRRNGYRPEPFGSASKALEAFESDPGSYAMAMSDLTMPEFTGFELARRIRALNPGLPIVIASGYLDEKSMAEMQSLALAGRLEKPYDVAGLLHKVRSVLQRGPAVPVLESV